jgi:hypothetical protein
MNTLIKTASIMLNVSQKYTLRTVSRPSITYCNNTKNITCQIIATDLDAIATLLETTRVAVGDVIPELLKSPVELQRLCKVPEL